MHRLYIADQTWPGKPTRHDKALICLIKAKIPGNLCHTVSMRILGRTVGMEPSGWHADIIRIATRTRRCT